MNNQELQRTVSVVNNNLARSAWSNYQKFLGLVLQDLPPYDFLDPLKKRFRARDFEGLLREAVALSAQLHADATQHYVAQQIVALIKKYPFPTTVVKDRRKKTALAKFWAAEHRCHRVNQRYRCYSAVRSPWESDLAVMRDWISYVLGPLDRGKCMEECDFGPGASIGVNGNATNFARKLLADSWTVTPGAVLYASAALAADNYIRAICQRDMHYGDNNPFAHEDWSFGLHTRVAYVNHNKIAFVPKDSTVFRTMAIEPLLNGYLQTGTDRYMRKLLKRVGIDLSDQRRNQRMAREGSFDEVDGYVTIDLSSASDSIATELVRYLLPPDWFEFLNSIRSREFLLDGKTYRYEKFASMGNGFCFPLESLIFSAACHAAALGQGLKPDFSVYGDDIIVRKSVAAKLLSLLKTLGFKTNPLKTFLVGPFRESCGADWYSGKCVRPVTLDYAFDTAESIFTFCNLVRRRGRTLYLQQAVEFLHNLLPPAVRFQRPVIGPVGTALEVDLDVFMGSPHASYKRELVAWSWRELVARPISDSLAMRHSQSNIALLRAAVRGASSACPFAIRNDSRGSVRVVASGGWGNTWLPGAAIYHGSTVTLSSFVTDTR